MYEGIVEIVECGQRQANRHLQVGYKLLAVLAGTNMVLNQANNQWFVRHGINYVVGRTADVAHLDYVPPPAPPKPATTAAAS